MPKASNGVERDQLLEWVERVAAFITERYGLTPITGRILGWLLVCEPPEQSGAQIANAIGASRASITTGMRLLTAGGFVRRRTRPGGRTTYYRIDNDAWEEVVRRRIASFAAFTEITGEGLEMLGPDNPRAARVRAAHAAYEWLTDLLGAAPPPRVTAKPD